MDNKIIYISGVSHRPALQSMQKGLDLIVYTGKRKLPQMPDYIDFSQELEKNQVLAGLIRVLYNGILQKIKILQLKPLESNDPVVQAQKLLEVFTEKSAKQFNADLPAPPNIKEAYDKLIRAALKENDIDNIQYKEDYRRTFDKTKEVLKSRKRKFGKQLTQPLKYRR